MFWTVAVLSISYASWPSPSASLRALEAAGSEEDRKKNLKILGDRGASLDEMRSFLREFVITDPSDPSSLSAVNKRLDTKRQALRDDRVGNAQVTLMVWAIPLVFLYAVGWSAGWIRRGFRG